MPQFNPSSMYNANQEYRIQKEGSKYRLYDLNPTNIIDMGWGARGAGGTATDLGLMSAAEIYQQTGNNVSNTYSFLQGGVEAYRAAAVPDAGTIQSQVSQTFSGFDPNNTTGWKEKLPELTTQAQQLYAQDPSRKDKVYGDVWNGFRYNTNNSQAIGQIQDANRIATGSGTINPPPGSTTSGNPIPNTSFPVPAPGSIPGVPIGFEQAYADAKNAQAMQQGGQAGKNVLPDSANKILDLAEQQAANTPNKGDISPNQFADWATIFHSNNDPYFKQLLTQSQQDLQTNLRQTAQELAAGERKLGAEYGANLASTQENLASRGLTNSSIRQSKEQTLADTTQSAIEAGRQLAERRALAFGTEAERKIGSTNLGDLSSFNVQGAPSPMLGRPGNYGLTSGTGTRSLFTPVGNTVGTNQRDQASLQEDYVNKQATNYRSLNPMG